ncbi:MAG: FAD-binding and (Fe-S)-binding domain-containing protein [Thermodesulfobacteriota bacterium]
MIPSTDYEKLANRIDGEVRQDFLRRYMLSTDGSIFQKIPACVVYPRSTADVAETVRFAGELELSVHSRGAGSGLCGAALGEGIVLDFSRYMNRLLKLDTDAKTFTCEPGYRFGELEEQLKGKGLFFPPDPSSGEYATFGGMAGTNASGAHSVKYGNVADYLLDAEVVLSDGSVATLSEIRNIDPQDLPENLFSLYRLYQENAAAIESAYPATRFNTAGYNLRGMVQDGRLDLRRLLAGSEGTLGVITRLTFQLIDKPAHDSLVVAFMDDITASAKAVQAVLPLGPSGIEVMDKSLLRLARSEDERLQSAIPEDVDNILLIEFDGANPQEPAAAAATVQELLADRGYSDRVHLAVSASEKAAFWAVRKAAVPILYKLKGEKKILALIEDAAVPTDRLVEYFEGVYELLNRHGVEFVTYGHIAKGLLHTRPLLNLKDPVDVALLRPIADDLFELVHGLGGSVSGEHGDGRLRSAYIRRAYPEIYPLFRKVKLLLDPDHLFNPEIITHHDPDQMARSLRFGAEYQARDVSAPILRWPEGMIEEAEKCHGCSKCTTVTSATRMCPLYKITRDENASPKAKANILRALISGAVEEKALYESAFQEVIDHCANCGSCAHECPSNVNIPKLAMEARARYAAEFGVPLQNRLLTGIEAAGRWTHKVSERLKPVMEIPLVKKAGERLFGVSARRNPVVFSRRPLRNRVRFREGDGDISVLYFAGCYASYIEPAIGEALVNTLTRMQMTVYTPEQSCCGLPHLTKGMAPEADAKIRRNLAEWGKLVGDVDHVVVTCSSCGYALMKDWQVLENDSLIQTVSEKTVHVSRLVNTYFDRLNPRRRKNLTLAYHTPCHLRIQTDPNSSLNLLSRIEGISVVDLQSNCCGMIGSWGMAADHFPLSRDIGADLIRKLNDSAADIGVTDCPTCRLQMAQFSKKPIRHPVEIISGLLSTLSIIS